MAFAFPIQQAPSAASITQTEIVFNEDEISNNLIKDNGSLFSYFQNKRYNGLSENSRDIYMKRKLLELRTLLESNDPFNSSISQILDNEHFKAIISFGDEIIPMILEELKFNSSYLVWAMNLITGQKISEGKVSLSEAARLWVSWGKQNKYIQ